MTISPRTVFKFSVGGKVLPVRNEASVTHPLDKHTSEEQILSKNLVLIVEEVRNLPSKSIFSLVCGSADPHHIGMVQICGI